jgi:hypothetical protein
MAAKGDDKKPKRVDVGFSGGQVLALRMTLDAHDSLRKALESDRSARWHEVETDDSLVAVDLAQVVYVRIDTEQQRVGF